MDDNKQFWERFSRHYAGFMRRSQATYQQICKAKNISGSIRDVADIEQRAKTKGVLEKRVELPLQDFQTLCEMAKASGKLQAENRSLRMQLQQSTMREQ